MKLRKGFVSNSSTSSFVIKNTSNEMLTLKDFINEVSFIYINHDENMEEVFKSIKEDDYIFDPGEEINVWRFGDHASKGRDPLWSVYLEDLNNCLIVKSKSFSWHSTRN